MKLVEPQRKSRPEPEKLPPYFDYDEEDKAVPEPKTASADQPESEPEESLSETEEKPGEDALQSVQDADNEIDGSSESSTNNT